MKLIVSIENGIATITTDGGAAVAVDFYFELSEMLNREYKHRRDCDFAARVPELTAAARWIFPANESERYGVRQCVYFFTAPTMPGLVKIGSAMNLSLRLSEHRKTYGRSIQVIAIAQLTEHALLERALHGYFRRWQGHAGQKTREWFDESVVVSWLQQTKAGLS